MTPNEAIQWLDAHEGLFASFARGMRTAATNAEHEKRGGGRRFCDAWLAPLLDVELEDAKAGSRQLAADNLGETKGLDEHRRLVMCYAKQRADQRQRAAPSPPLFIDGEPTFRCGTCRDRGYVFCWHYQTIAGFRGPGDPEEVVLYDQLIACSCEEGFEYARLINPDQPDSVHRYDPAVHCRIETSLGNPAELKRLKAFITQRGADVLAF